MWKRDPSVAVALAAIVTVSVAMDAVFFTGFLASDDVLYLTAARQVLETGRMWPEPPSHEARLFLIGWCALALTALGANVQGVAASFVLFHQILNVLTFLLGARLSGRTAGLVAAALSATFPVLVLFSTTVLPDIPMTAALVGAYLALRSAYGEERGQGHRTWCLVVAGGLLGVSSLAKESALVALPFFVVSALLGEWKAALGRGALRGMASRLCALVAGLGVVLALETVTLRLLTGSWTFRLASLVHFGGPSGPTLLSEASRRAQLVARTVGAHEVASAVALVAVLAAAAYAWRRPGTRSALLFAGWYAAYYTWGTARLGFYYPPSLQVRYFTTCIPFLLVAAASSLDELFRWGRRQPRLGPAMKPAAAVLAAAVFLGSAWWCDRAAGRLYGAPLVAQTVRVLRASPADSAAPVVISNTVAAQVFPLLWRRPPRVFLSHEVTDVHLEQWRSQAGFRLVDLDPTSPLRRPDLDPLLQWEHGPPASEGRAEALVARLLDGSAGQTPWTLRPVGRFDRTAPRTAEIRLLLGDVRALGQLEGRPDRGLRLYEVQAAGRDLRYPLTPLDAAALPAIVNAGFAQWRDGRPDGWLFRDTHPARGHGPGGEDAVVIGPGRFCYAWQALEVPVTLAGRSLALRARARSETPGSTRLWMKVAWGEEWDEAFGDFHPGDGTWRELDVVLPVPPAFAGGELRLALLQTGTEGRAAFTDVRLAAR